MKTKKYGSSRWVTSLILMLVTLGVWYFGMYVCDIKSILTDTVFLIVTLLALIVMLFDIVLALIFLQSDSRSKKKK
ncbi:hypothetical protein SAMN04487761_1576 [Lachnospiraceae bacterium C7]|nr:hypothetical protein SAMN04487761_1576 [Lachnospiraceae bacterium C7]